MAQIHAHRTGYPWHVAGLALRQTAQPPPSSAWIATGRRRVPARNNWARVERTELWIANACKNAALVILNEPFSRLRDMLAACRGKLAARAAVRHLYCPLMVPVLAWADELLPEGISFIADTLS